MLSLEINPVLQWWGLSGIGFLVLLVLAYGIIVRAPSTWPRVIFLTIGFVALLNPTVIRQERAYLPDVVAVLVDESLSQSATGRLNQVRDVSEELQQLLLEEDDLDLRLSIIGDPDRQDGTFFVEALSKMFSDVPPDRVAGAFIITDGQLHDDPSDFIHIDYPLNFLLVGDPEKNDRHLVIEEAPSYAIVGEEAIIRVRVAGDSQAGAIVPVRLSINGQVVSESNASSDTPIELPIIFDKEGVSAVELQIDEGEQELTLENNRLLLAINAVRSRLSVMLVSGAPGPGLRSVRNLLKADPAVDLVHFTVLRPPNKQDLTPVDELSLITFPSDELFSVRLREFDLIIFDRYHRRGIFPASYLNNIADYVVDGGAILDIAGPSFVTPLSLAASPLGKILPARPTGDVFEQAFAPTVSERGNRHPVTSDLRRLGETTANSTWGRWFRLFDSEVDRGEVLLTGVGDRPLLVLDRVGEGRVAQLLSDQSWLWARGYEGGGPQQVLMRRLVHWLMKQPDLEENSLMVDVDNKKLKLVRRSLDGGTGPVTMIGPDGVSQEISLAADKPGLDTAIREVSEAGIYRLEQEDYQAIAIVGETKLRELADVRATQGLVEPLATASGGSITWLEAVGLPSLTRVARSQIYDLEDSVGLIRNDQFEVTGLNKVAVLPSFALLCILLISAIWSWRQEGQKVGG